MQTKDLVVRCYAKRDGELWVAVCIDLSLAAQADTLEEVIPKLEAQIFDYVCEAFAEPQYAAALLQRKAPLSQVATFYWIKTVNQVARMKDVVGRIVELALPVRPEDPRFGGNCKVA